jgi:hypothetical protein
MSNGSKTTSDGSLEPLLMTIYVVVLLFGIGVPTVHLLQP